MSDKPRPRSLGHRAVDAALLPASLSIASASESVGGWLRALNAPVSETALTRALTEYLTDAMSRPDAADLTAADATFLAEHSGAREATEDEVAEVLAETAAEFTALIVTSRSSREAADASGLDPSTVRHRVANGELYSVLVEGRRRLPAFQFADDGKPLPGLSQVLAAVPRTWHPLSVAGFFTTPQPELEIEDRAVTPREWLATGGDPRLVAALAADEDLTSVTA